MSIISQQFGRPVGLLGRIAGWIMTYRPSNVERNTWAVAQLELEPTDRVLEIGFGPGVAIQMIAQTLREGVVWGIDHSAEMLRQASRRNAAAIRKRRARLMVASVAELPTFDAPFDKILDVNSFQFWEEKVASLTHLRAWLRPGGRLVLVHQPRSQGASAADTAAAGDTFTRYLERAGYHDVRVAIKSMKPVPVVGVMGLRP